MDLTRKEIDALLGAWALDALDAPTIALIDAEIERDPDLARQAHRLRQVVAGFGESVASTPPSDVRATMLERAAGVERAPRPVSTPPQLFANQVESLVRLLETLEPVDWRRPARPYDWNVHELVAHLLVIERYTAMQLGLAAHAPVDEIHHLAMGADTIVAEASTHPRDTMRAWQLAATSTRDAIAGFGPSDLNVSANLHGWSFTAATALIARSFEIWTHADDIRRTIGRPLEAPEPADLRAMSSVSVNSLPLVLSFVAPSQAFGGARIVLTGEGGGTYDVGVPDRRDSLLVIDVVDYCRLAARRIESDDLEMSVEGDTDVARHLLAASRAFAI